MITGRPLREMVLSFLSAALLCIIFFVADYFDGTEIYHSEWYYAEPWAEPIVWAPFASLFAGVVAGIYIFYILAPYAVYHHAKQKGRNAVRWTTAFVVFTPLLAGIAYLLTWPKK